MAAVRCGSRIVGLAALADDVVRGEIRSGTPAYMSPEQKAGREVTTRIDS